MTNSQDPIEMAKDLLKEGDNLVSEKKFEDALIKYHFVPKYAKVMGDHKLAAIGYIKILKILIMKGDLQQAFPHLSLALRSVQRCDDPYCQKELIDLLKNNPEFEKGFSEYRKLFK